MGCRKAWTFQPENKELKPTKHQIEMERHLSNKNVAVIVSNSWINYFIYMKSIVINQTIWFPGILWNIVDNNFK